MIYTIENYFNSHGNDEFEFTCKHCGKIFIKTKEYIRKNNGSIPSFCCKKCMYEFRDSGTITVTCANCGKQKEIKKSEYNSKIKRYNNTNFFCNNSCSASYNNVHREKKINNLNICPECGGKKYRTSVRCQICENNNRSVIGEKELGEYIGYSGNTTYRTHKCQEIIKNAKKVLEQSDIEKVCKYCKNHEFDEILEVHHIKNILSFSPDTKIKEINSVDNLVWLCPNHHTMLERGLIILEE